MRYSFTAVRNNGKWECKSNDLQGCVSEGDTLTQAIFALEHNELEWIKFYQIMGLPVPKEEGEADGN